MKQRALVVGTGAEMKREMLTAKRKRGNAYSFERQHTGVIRAHWCLSLAHIGSGPLAARQAAITLLIHDYAYPIFKSESAVSQMIANKGRVRMVSRQRQAKMAAI